MRNKYPGSVGDRKRGRGKGSGREERQSVLITQKGETGSYGGNGRADRNLERHLQGGGARRIRRGRCMN